jgi:putative ABC transport system permease protein
MGSFLLAWREARRAKGRFGLLTGAVTVLVFLVVFQQAVLDGLVTEFVGAIRNQSADVLVYGEDARLNLQGSVVPPVAPEEVAAVEGVARAEPLGVAAVTVEAGGELEDATLFGHVLDGPGAPVEIEEGRRPERDGEAVASASAADDGFGVGDVVVVQPGGERIVIVGTARETSFSVTPTLFASYATYEAVQLSVNPDAPAVVPSAVAVQVEDGADASAVAERITAEVEGVEAATRDRAADEAPGVQSVNQSLSIVLLLTYVVVTIVTGFFFLILTVQKQPTLTLLRAVGAPARSLVAALGMQVLLVVGGGFVLGAALAALVLRVVSVGIEAGVAPGALVTTAVAVLLLAAVACVGAARRITRLDPVWATLPGATPR